MPPQFDFGNPDWCAVWAVAQPSSATEQTAEVRNAWSELTDLCEGRIRALTSALATGRSARVGEGKWEHANLSTAAVVPSRSGVS